jgi:single-strand selective monofunctional uracil DNA glycosylase
MSLPAIADELAQKLSGLAFGPPVAHVYNPLTYARAAHHQYLERYGRGRRGVVVLGMNPGPWGMMQTGVPFGEVRMVREWLGIDAPIAKPAREHPHRPICGYACTRSEVSGARLWGWARDRFGTPERFFSLLFVANYCPLCFLESSGRNVTPDKLPLAERRPLLEACDAALRATVACLEPRCVLGVGKFAEQRARAALADAAVDVTGVIHPSPASPLANRGWAQAMDEAVAACGVALG